MRDLERYLPATINEGAFVTAYSRPRLAELVRGARLVLPICSLGTPAGELAALGELVLPPLYHEALDEPLRGELVERILQCFPFYEGTAERACWTGTLEVVELPRGPLAPDHQAGHGHLLALLQAVQVLAGVHLGERGAEVGHDMAFGIYSHGAIFHLHNFPICQIIVL